jgi:hypothetical protein
MVHDGAGQGVERYEVSQHPCSLPARNIIIIQGGSDISGTLSKLNCCIKKKFLLLILLPKTI